MRAIVRNRLYVRPSPNMLYYLYFRIPERKKECPVPQKRFK